MNNVEEDFFCPLCGSGSAKHLADVRDVEYFTSEILYSYFECTNCQCIYLSHPPTNRLEEIYPDNYYSNEGPNEGPNEDATSLMGILLKIKEKFDKRFFTRVLALVEAETLNCLDVGGGSGWLLNVARKSDNRIMSTTVLDLNQLSKSIAEKNGHHFIHGNVENLERINEFDVVFMLNLIEHVSDPRDVLLTLKRSMKPNGILIIKTPNTNSLNRKMFQKKYWGGYHAPRHFVLFNKENFFSLASEVGLEISKFKYTQGTPQWAASVIGTFTKVRPSPTKEPMTKSLYWPWLLLVFAVFDVIRAPLFKTDQMFIVLRKKSDTLV